MPYDLIIGRNEADKKDFKKRGLAYIGKSYVKMGQYSSLSNPIFLDVARTHVMLISGKRGSGKCLHGDTLISLGDGSQISIKDLAENKENVMSLNENLKIGSARRSEFFSREVTKLLKLKLRSGKEIKLTPEHPLLTVKGWKPVQDLAVGSRIATPRKIEAFGKNSLPEYEIKLLSYLLAEGHTKKIVLFANSDDKIVEDFESSLKEFDPSLKLVKEKENHYRITDPCWKTKVLSHDKQRNSRGQFLKGSKNIVKKRSIRKLIEREEMFGLLAIEKYISKNLMNLNKESLSLFLNRLFSCDGSLYKANNYWEGSYSSSSKKLIRQVHSLLLKFGILSRIRDKRIVHKGKEFKSYEVVINSENLVKFIEQIGFFGDKAKKEFIAKQEILAKKRNTNIDTIPQEIWENFKPSSWVKIGKALNYKHPKSARERIRYAPSRNTLLSVAEVEQNQELQLLAQSDIFWDEVSSVEEINGKFTVYDISVPKNHNFVANDIIVHNSYTMGSIAESLSDLNKEESGNIASLIFDTMGIYWTMKFKNEKDKTLLKEWGLKSKNVPVKVFAPSGHFKKLREEGVAVDKEFAIKVSELDATDWLGVFDLEFTDPVGVAIERAIASLKENKKTYSFSDIFDALNASGESEQNAKSSAMAFFEAARGWGVFDEKSGTTIKELIKAGETTVIDLSMYASIGAFNIRALVIGLVSKKLFNERMKSRKIEEVQSVQHGASWDKHQTIRDMPLVWIFIDEAHEFLPHESVGKTPSSDALIQILREGRQPGLSIVLATQQPGKIHTDAITQSDIVLSHRVTAELDVKALNAITQSYLYSSITNKINDLPKLKGSAIILDDNSERIYPMRVRPRFTWHGGEAPMAIRKEDD